MHREHKLRCGLGAMRNAEEHKRRRDRLHTFVVLRTNNRTHRQSNPGPHPTAASRLTTDYNTHAKPKIRKYGPQPPATATATAPPSLMRRYYATQAEQQFCSGGLPPKVSRNAWKGTFFRKYHTWKILEELFPGYALDTHPRPDMMPFFRLRYTPY